MNIEKIVDSKGKLTEIIHLTNEEDEIIESAIDEIIKNMLNLAMILKPPMKNLPDGCCLVLSDGMA